MLQFISKDGIYVVYINPHLVSVVTGDIGGNDEWCEITTTRGVYNVKGRAAEAQLRVWKALED